MNTLAGIQSLNVPPSVIGVFVLLIILFAAAYIYQRSQLPPEDKP